MWAVDCESLFAGVAAWRHLVGMECGITGTQSQLANGNFLIMWGVYGAMTKITTGFTGLVEVVPATGVVARMWVATRGVPAWAVPYIPTWALYVDAMVLNHQVTHRREESAAATPTERAKQTLIAATE